MLFTVTVHKFGISPLWADYLPLVKMQANMARPHTCSKPACIGGGRTPVNRRQGMERTQCNKPATIYTSCQEERAKSTDDLRRNMRRDIRRCL